MGTMDVKFDFQAFDYLSSELDLTNIWHPGGSDRRVLGRGWVGECKLGAGMMVGMV